MAGQDIKKRLAPGQPQPVNVGGDYIFLKFADRPVDIVITGGRSGGTRVTMEAGDKYRPGRFDAFEVQNTDQDNPAQVTLTVGEGDYNRQFVKGEIVVDPRVKTADGLYVSDSRAEHKVLVTLDYKREPAINAGDGELLTAIGNGALTQQPVSGYRGLTPDGDNYRLFHQRSTPWLLTVDKNGVLLKEDECPEPVAPVAINAAKYYGGLWYVAAGNKVYPIQDGRDPLDQMEESEALSYQPAGVTWDDLFFIGETLYGVESNATSSVHSFDEQKVILEQPNETWSAAFNDGGKIVAISNNEAFRVYQNTGGAWELERSGSFGFNIGDPIGGYVEATTGRWVIGEYDTGTDDWEIYSVEPETFAAGEIHYGSATEVCTKLPGLVNRALTNEIRTEAVVSVEWENGKAYATGEVLKAILDLLGINTDGEYLDGITAFKAEAKNRTYNINLGGRTFAADKIADDFQSVELPQVVSITALESLWSDR